MDQRQKTAHVFKKVISMNAKNIFDSPPASYELLEDIQY